MASVRSLYVSLSLRADDYNNKIKAAQRESREFEKTIRPTKQLLSEIGSTMTVVGGIVSAALFGLAKKAADYGDEMLEASQKTGISTKQLAALRLMAEQSGSSFEGMTSGVTKLSKSLFEAATKGGESAKTFAALGISIKDAGGNIRQASDVLPEVAERFAHMKDGTEKTAIAIRLFGKAGADLIPTLNQGAEGFKRAAALVEKYNVDLGAGNKLGDDFNDSLKETGLATQGVANQIGAALLPGLIKLVQIGNNALAMVSSFAKAHPEWTRGIAMVAGALTGTGGLILGLTVLLTILPKVKLAFTLLQGSMFAVTSPILILTAAVIGLTAAFIAFPETRGPILSALKAIYVAFSILGSPIRAAGVALMDFAGIASDVVHGRLDAATKKWMGMFDNVKNSVKDATLGAGANFDAFVGLAGEAATKLNSSFKMPNAAELAKQIGDIDLDGFAKDAKVATDRVTEMWNSLKKENTEGVALEAVLMRASAAHISLDTILDKLGPTIKDVAGEMIQSTELMPEYIAHYNALRLSAERFAEAQEEAAAANQALNKSIFESREEMRLAAKQAIEITRSGMTQATIDAAEAVGKHRLELQKSTLTLRTQQQMLRDTAAQMAALSKAGYSAAQIESMLGQSIEGVAQELRDLGAPLDSVQAKILRQSVEAQKFRNAWAETFAAISDRLVDMIVDFDFSWKRLADIGKQTAKDLARSFLDGFFTPFKEGLASLGRQAADAISGIVFGTKSASGGGSALGGLAGAIGGLFGGGGGGFGGVRPNGSIAGTDIGGAGGAATSAGMSAALGWASLGASLIGPVADQLNKIGAGRDSANEIVKAQNAFQQSLADILGDSGLSATNKLKQVNNVWSAYEANLGRFSAGGGENATTANQSFATLSPLVSKIQSDLIAGGASEESAIGSGSFIINVTISPTIYFEGTELTPLAVRDIVVPEMLIELDSGVRGAAEKLRQIINGPTGSTPAVAGI